MKIILNLITLGMQVIMTFVALLLIYMIFVLLDYQGGIDGLIGTALFQPIIGGLISAITIGICLLIGLPVRFNDRINTWWPKRIWISLLGTVIGLLILTLSLMPSMAETIKIQIDTETVRRELPNLGFVATGWFLTGFSFLHLFPPYRFRGWIEEVIRKHTGGGSENVRQHQT